MAQGFKSLKGHFILDGGKLKGSFFDRAVVLICQHDPDGAFGLVLNRMTGSKVDDAISADIPNTLKHLDVHLGGPVQPTAMTFLHTDACLLNASVMPNVGMGHSVEELLELGESYSPTQRIRIFAGYAGWSPGQLESELATNSWLVHPASAELVFDTDPNDLWKTILHAKGWQYRLLANAPEDLSLN